jgi:hypothetical protein
MVEEEVLAMDSTTEVRPTGHHQEQNLCTSCAKRLGIQCNGAGSGSTATTPEKKEWPTMLKAMSTMSIWHGTQTRERWATSPAS